MPDVEPRGRFLNLESAVRIIRLGYKNFWRNSWLTLGATLLMTLTLTMISASLILSYLVKDTVSIISSKIDIVIYFRDDAVPDEKLQALGTAMKKIPEVTETRFVNKAEALSIWNRLPINSDIKKPVTVENNPLPRSLEVKTVRPETIQTVVTQIAALDGEKIICSECVSYTKNKSTVDRLVSITRFVQRAGIGLSLFFGLIAIFNVLNIIRITIAARSDEIEIMRFVGASNSFIRGPFVIEGILYGLLGTLATTAFILGIAKLVSPYLNSAFTMLGINFYEYVVSMLPQLIGLQLGIGLVLGVIVSLISIRRYLRA